MILDQLLEHPFSHGLPSDQAAMSLVTLHVICHPLSTFSVCRLKSVIGCDIEICN